MKKAFTLAEVLITLAIIGVVAALTIPSVIVNTQQQEFKTGLKKAVSVLNNAITLNQALEGESPYDNSDLFEYLQQHMSVIKSTSSLSWNAKVQLGSGSANSSRTYANNAFYTTDGMRFEIPKEIINKLVVNDEGSMASIDFNEGIGRVASGSSGMVVNLVADPNGTVGKCGSRFFKANSDTSYAPCIIMVDVNGDRKPTPSATSGDVAYVFPSPADKKLADIFTIIITEEKAIPYGVVAQRAMYNSK